MGGSNAFNAVPADRGQTQLFLPYQQPKRVAVTWNGKSDLTWQLNLHGDRVEDLAILLTKICRGRCGATADGT